MDDEQAIVARMRAGDGEAMRALVSRYHRPLFAFVYRLTGDYALADDISQETFIRMTRQRGTPPHNIRAWAFTVARNLAYDHYRTATVRRERSTDFEADAESPADSVALEQAAIDADRDSTVSAQLQQLPPEQREAVILRYYHDMPLNDIAAVTDAPLGTVKSRLFLALKRLRDGLLVKGFAYE